MIQRPLKIVVPVAGGLRKVRIPVLAKVRLVLIGGQDLAVQIFGEFRAKDRVCQLFQQNGREVQVGPQGNSIAFQIVNDAQ